MTDLDELELLARRATPGPWTAPEPVCFDVLAPDAGEDGEICSTWSEDNTRYIAAASPDVILELIARVRAAEARANEARSIAEHYLAESSSIRSDEAIVRLTDVCEEIREATTKP